MSCAVRCGFASPILDNSENIACGTLGADRNLIRGVSYVDVERLDSATLSPLWRNHAGRLNRASQVMEGSSGANVTV